MGDWDRVERGVVYTDDNSDGNLLYVNVCVCGEGVCVRGVASTVNVCWREGGGERSV